RILPKVDEPSWKNANQCLRGSNAVTRQPRGVIPGRAPRSARERGRSVNSARGRGPSARPRAEHVREPDAAFALADARALGPLPARKARAGDDTLFSGRPFAGHDRFFYGDH